MFAIFFKVRILVAADVSRRTPFLQRCQRRLTSAATLSLALWPNSVPNGALTNASRVVLNDKPMNREKEIFEQALDLGSAQERMAFLKGACGADTDRKS